MNSCFLVGEIGINHNGNLNFAKKLINEAKIAGFDAVKFQKRDINVVYSQDYLNESRKSPWGNTQRVQKEALEFSLSDYWEIDNYCKELDIDWFVSCWDINSQIEMRVFSTKWNKVASAMATNIPFLEVVASEKKHTFVSTGMTSLEEIEKCINIFNKYDCPITLLHTVSTYPAEEADPDRGQNLRGLWWQTDLPASVERQGGAGPARREANPSDQVFHSAGWKAEALLQIGQIAESSAAALPQQALQTLLGPVEAVEFLG